MAIKLFFKSLNYELKYQYLMQLFLIKVNALVAGGDKMYRNRTKMEFLLVF